MDEDYREDDAMRGLAFGILLSLPILGLIAWIIWG
jgi:hypothetical protein